MFVLNYACAESCVCWTMRVLNHVCAEPCVCSTMLCWIFMWRFSRDFWLLQFLLSGFSKFYSLASPTLALYLFRLLLSGLSDSCSLNLFQLLLSIFSNSCSLATLILVFLASRVHEAVKQHSRALSTAEDRAFCLACILCDRMRTCMCLSDCVCNFAHLCETFLACLMSHAHLHVCMSDWVLE
jgi:hypothetical protein